MSSQVARLSRRHANVPYMTAERSECFFLAVGWSFRKDWRRTRGDRVDGCNMGRWGLHGAMTVQDQRVREMGVCVELAAVQGAGGCALTGGHVETNGGRPR